MKEDIINLVKLQEKDDEIRALQSRLAAIPKEVEALEKEIADERMQLKQADDALEEGQKAQRAAEGELSDAEQRVSKYQEQLMNVKSNVEYKTMQHQIETSKGEISDVETKILQGLDLLEELAQKKKEREGELGRGQVKVDAMEKELDSEKKKLEAELASRRAAREEVLKLVPEDLLEDYQKIASTRGGIGMAAAIEERCQVCMVRVRPQAFQELKSFAKMHYCRSCQRILYYVSEEQAPA